MLFVDGNTLYAGGAFDWITAGGSWSGKYIAQFQNGVWSAVGTTITGDHPFCSALATYGGKLFVGGLFPPDPDYGLGYIVTWDGHVRGYPGRLDGPVVTFTMFNGDLFAGGSFNLAWGHPNLGGIARYDGTWAGWHPFGTGMMNPDSNPGDIYALAVYNGELIAGGDFRYAASDPGRRDRPMGRLLVDSARRDGPIPTPWYARSPSSTEAHRGRKR